MQNIAKRSGQATLEYILVFVALFGLYFALKNFFAPAAKEAAERTTALVTCDGP